jgi:NADPH-dependent 2,4-dienoyl-CoA reductase/sulfur reductase-like enzyme
VTRTRVSVTEKHIADGKRCNGAECPIALALLEALAAQGAADVTVLVEVDVVLVALLDADGPRQFRAEMPPQATAFVEHLDDAEHVEPFEFVLTWREVIV